jgi:hypothetical protein
MNGRDVSLWILSTDEWSQPTRMPGQSILLNDPIEIDAQPPSNVLIGADRRSGTAENNI